MSSELAISVRGLCKHYQIYDRPHDRLKQMLWRGRRQFYRDFHALGGINLDVRKGEVVGIIGRNGSGKSTLLQVITGTIRPSAGEVKVSGRVAALLELGAGFNPDFTGRENIYMNGSIIGLSRRQIDQRIDAILAFADIGAFVDQPIRTYSSGMYIRLAFAIAINVEPDILIIDEALAVGDEAFQRKCFSRIRAIRKAGATILFVSHSPQMIVQLCDRAVLIDRGELLLSGRPKFVVGKYHKLVNAPVDRVEQVRAAILDDAARSPSGEADPLADTDSGQDADADYDEGLISQSLIAYESRGARIRDLHLATEQGEQVNILRRGGQYLIRFAVDFQQRAEDVGFGMMVKTVSGLEIGGGTTSGESRQIARVEAGAIAEIEFRFTCNLNSGTYFVNAGTSAVVDGERLFLHRLLDGGLFRVAPEDNDLATGLVDLQINPSIRLER